MKTLTISTVSAALLLAGATAHAQGSPMNYQPSPYLGGDVLFWELDSDGGDDFNSTGLRLRGGVAFNDYFALEGHLGTGGSDGSLDLEYLTGAYAKGIVPIAPEFRLYGLAGFSEVDVDADSESGFSYGAGAEFDVAPNLAVGADYMRYLDESNYTFDAASVGVTFRF
ncbi:porin family protein [Halomonas daqiaonensis]|uniref:Outer membrane autotransporter barrel domain-containing protein n=1 Tax=Halomonas daqiaonensis TaxID=650850 RepID=A0A1H7TDR9_9GAMM|nr:porin family protein [Halomonas daqiaonensis]SEL82456.1 outer membrane autotransporter barrel domain-containing protein [Halomonas daqiaonensis]